MANDLSSLRSGIYTDGLIGAANYFVLTVVSPVGAITGAIDSLYLEGQSDVALTFIGTGQDNVANLQVSYSNAANEA